ncbi:MAG: hypothetical protein ACO259_10145 [Bacteroidia bacterium]
MEYSELEKNVAIAICKSCYEDPFSSGDCKGNEFRWQDYLDSAVDAIHAIQYNGYEITAVERK